MLDDMQALAPIRELQATARTLNRGRLQALQAEWELASLWALSRTCCLEFKPAAGPRTLDFRVWVPITGSAAVEVIGDVTTASDESAEKRNPLVPFLREVARRASKKGITSGTQWKLEGEKTESKRSPRMVLKIPRPDDFAGEFGLALDQFLAAFARGGPSIFRYRHGHIDVAIAYTGRKESGGSYPSYTLPYSNTANPVYAPLLEKADQLRDAETSAPSVVILCDGGCDLLQHKPFPAEKVTLNSVLRHFFREHGSVSAVVILTSDRPWPAGATVPWGPPRLQTTHYRNPWARHPIDDQVLQRFADCFDALPSPADDSRNAYLRVTGARRGKGLSHYGGWHMSENEVKISSLGLHRLLAGDVDLATFLRDHQWDEGNPFARWLRGGKAIAGISFESDRDRDGDWIIFRFSRDAALSAFKVGTRD